MNVSRLLAVRAHILAHPEEFDMLTMCGSAYCIGGTAAALFTDRHPSRCEWGRTEGAAREALGLTTHLADDLFYGESGDEWTGASRGGVWASEHGVGSLEYAAEGAAWIDGFVERHGTEEERAAYAAGLPVEAVA